MRTATTTGGERREDASADGDGFDLGTDLDNRPDELVPHDSAVIQPLFTSEEGMKIRPAQPGCFHTDYDVLWILDPGIGQIPQADLFSSFETETAHKAIQGA